MCQCKQQENVHKEKKQMQLEWSESMTVLNVKDCESQLMNHVKSARKVAHSLSLCPKLDLLTCY